jgi:hypothetical protein
MDYNEEKMITEMSDQVHQELTSDLSMIIEEKHLSNGSKIFIGTVGIKSFTFCLLSFSSL